MKEEINQEIIHFKQRLNEFLTETNRGNSTGRE